MLVQRLSMCYWIDITIVTRFTGLSHFHFLRFRTLKKLPTWGPQRGNTLGKRSLLGAPGVLQTFHTTQMESQQAKCPPSINCLLYGMLYVLTGIYWASISAARAPKGRFCPDFLSFVVQFWAKIVFSPNIGVWGVQIIATERPAHTSLLQPIWNHPAQGNGQKQAKKGSFGPKVPLLVALEVLGGHGGPDLVTTVTGCSACVGLMVITHFGLILGLFCMVWYVIWFYCMVLRWILLHCNVLHDISLYCITWHGIVLYLI